MSSLPPDDLTMPSDIRSAISASAPSGVAALRKESADLQHTQQVVDFFEMAAERLAKSAEWSSRPRHLASQYRATNRPTCNTHNGQWIFFEMAAERRAAVNSWRDSCSLENRQVMPLI